MMKSKLIAVALVAGLGSPAAASVLDFTTSSIGTGSTGGTTAFGVGYTISGFGGTLTDATHGNDNGCDSYACDAVGGSFDVGFGVDSGDSDNPNEVDGIDDEEYVQVTFDKVVRILGFAGMLTYNDSLGRGTEQVKLSYSSDGGTTFDTILGDTQNTDADVGGTDNTFGTVGLSFRDGLLLNANVVRFSAAGTGTFDDGNANITAAALEVAPVPVPAALPLLLAGMGAFGFAARRKKRMAS